MVSQSQPQCPRFEALLARVAEAAAQLLGADRVDLRSYRRLPPSMRHVSGAAYIGYGLMEVGHDVPEFIEDMLRSQQRQLTRPELGKLCKVLGTLLHESIHLALPSEYSLGAGRVGRTAASGVFLEEGVTESATQSLLPHLLAQLEPMFPGISRQVPDRSRHYSNYVPATRELLSLISALPEMQGRDALHELAREGPERKMDLLVEQAMEGFGLTFNVPARDREEVRSRIRSALEAHVQRNQAWMVPPDPKKPAHLNTREPAALSTIMGMQMGFELLRQLYTEGERAGMDLPQGWRRRLAASEVQAARELVEVPEYGGLESRLAVEYWIEAAESRARQLSSPTDSPKARRPHSVPNPQHRRRQAYRSHIGRGIQ